MSLYFLLRKLNTNMIVIFLCTCIIIYFITFPKLCINSTISGARIFFLSVFPSLFPFLIICNILIQYNGIDIYSKYLGKFLCTPLRLPIQCSLTIIISSLCGYPLGAKYCCELYENKMIDKKTCERLLNIASNAGPIFVVGTVGTSMLNSKNIGYLLLVSNYISCILMSFIIKPVPQLNQISIVKRKGENFNEVNIGSALKSSIENALKSTMSIGGYIVFFCVVIDILRYNTILDYIFKSISNRYLPYDIIKPFFLGLVELTKGCQLISIANAPLYLKTIIIGFLMGFSGLSIISQVYSFVYEFSELSIIKYIKRKFIQGILCSIVISVLTVPFNYISVNTVFNNGEGLLKTPLLALLTFILILPILLYHLKKLLHIA